MSLGKRLISTEIPSAVCTTDTADVFGDSSGVALYNLDYDASDASGSYDGTPTDVTFGVGGQINYGARFNGSSSYVNLGTGSSGLSGLLNQKVSQSVSFWMNTSYTGISGNSIIYSVYAGGGISLNIYYLTNGTLYFLTRYSNNSTTFTTTQTFNDSQWHHIAVTIDVDDLERKIYIDNSLVSTQTLSSASYGGGGTTGVALGTNGNFNTQYYKGDLDQVRIFNKALTSGEVDTLYNNGDGETACVYDSTTDIVNYPTGTTPVAYYKLDNSSEDFSTGGNDGTDTNIEYRFGRYGQAARFSGNGYISGLPTVQNTSEEFSVSMWFNTTVNPSVQHTMLGGIKEQGTNDSVFALKMLNDGYSKLYLRGTDGTLHILADTVDATDGNWHHLVATVSSSSGVFYVDGQQVDSATISNNITVDNLLIGAENNRGTLSPVNYFDGDIDQVRIYSTALTSSQVTELYNEKPETDTSTFKTVLYEGNNSTQYISNVGFQPDLVWIKNRDVAVNHYLYDSIRGTGAAKALHSNTTDSESSASTYSVNGGVQSIDSNGFTVFKGTDNTYQGTNKSGNAYVGWCWKSGADAVSNTVGDIASQVSANDKGFSIVKHANSGSTSDTVGHGLTVDGVATTPELYITKKYDTTTSWNIYTTVIDGSMDRLLFTTAAKSDVSLNAPTSTVFYNQSGTSDSKNYISYCFASVSGVSKIGSYTGSGSATEKPISTGFEPSFVMIKKTSNTGDWFMHDNKRLGTHGYSDKYLKANASSAEIDSSDNDLLEFTDTGFTLRTTFGDYNQLNGEYIYMAFK